MSWDIFVQKIPADARTLDDIPADFRPASIGQRSDIISKVKEVAPSADFSNPAWGVIEGDDYSIEVNLGSGEEVMSFVFHVRGSGEAANVVADILRRLGLRGLDSGTGNIFDPDRASSGFEEWRRYREQAVDG
jgi:hypothetical protein